MNKTILPNIELKNGKRRCSHQFSIKALATTSPNGFLAVVVLILPITVQNFFFPIVESKTRKLWWCLSQTNNFLNLALLNSNVEKWEKNQLSSNSTTHFSWHFTLVGGMIEYCPISNTLPRTNWQSFMSHRKYLHLMFRKVTRRPIKPTSTSSYIDLVIDWIFTF